MDLFTKIYISHSVLDMKNALDRLQCHGIYRYTRVLCNTKIQRKRVLHGDARLWKTPVIAHVQPLVFGYDFERLSTQQTGCLVDATTVRLHVYHADCQLCPINQYLTVKGWRVRCILSVLFIWKAKLRRVRIQIQPGAVCMKHQ